jgi:hypothetical protein
MCEEIITIESSVDVHNSSTIDRDNIFLSWVFTGISSSGMSRLNIRPPCCLKMSRTKFPVMFHHTPEKL